MLPNGLFSTPGTSLSFLFVNDIIEVIPFVCRPDLVEGSRYEHRWADRSEFSEVLVTPSMLMDHYPDNVYRALVDIASSTSGTPVYSVIWCNNDTMLIIMYYYYCWYIIILLYNSLILLRVLVIFKSSASMHCNNVGFEVNSENMCFQSKL